MSTQKKTLLVVFVLIIVGLNIGVNTWRKSNQVPFRLREYKPLDANTDLSEVQFDQNGNLWFRVTGKYPALEGVALFVSDKDGNSIITYTKEDIGISPSAFIIDPYGRVIVSGEGADFEGLSVFDGTSWKLTTLSTAPCPGFAHFAIDPKGQAWVSTNCVLDDFWVLEDGSTWIKQSIENSGLDNDSIFDIAFDKAGRVWIGTRYGLKIFDGTDWITYTTGNSPIHSNTVYGITFDKQNRAWLNNDDGISIFDGKNWTIFTSDDLGLSDHIYGFVMTEDDRVLIYQSDYLCILDKNRCKFYSFANTKPEIAEIQVDDMKNIWLQMPIFYESRKTTFMVLPSNFASAAPTVTQGEDVLLLFSPLYQISMTLLLINIYLMFVQTKWRTMGVGVTIGLVVNIAVLYASMVDGSFPRNLRFEMLFNPGTWLTIGVLVSGFLEYLLTKNRDGSVSGRSMVIGGAICLVLWLCMMIYAFATI